MTKGRHLRTIALTAVLSAGAAVAASTVTGGSSWAGPPDTASADSSRVEGYFANHRDCQQAGQDGVAAGQWSKFQCSLVRTTPRPSWVLTVDG